MNIQKAPLIAIAFLLLSCGNRNNLLVRPIEVLLTISSTDTVHGKVVVDSAPGARDLYCIDSLLCIESSDPASQLKILSTDSYDIIAQLCPKGRARNEFIDPISGSKQIYEKSGRKYLLMYDNFLNIKTINITESLNEGRTIVDDVIPSYLNYRVGNSIFLCSKAQWFNYKKVSYTDPRDGIYNPPHFYLSTGNKEEEISVFNNVMDFPEGKNGLIDFVYEGNMRLKPDQSKIVFSTFYMPYLLIFDLESNEVKMFHEKGKLSYSAPYPNIEGNNDIEMFFGDVSVTNDFIICTYLEGTQGDYRDPNKRPCVMVFNWEGEYLTGFHLDHRTYRITYDEYKKNIYGLDTSNGKEQIIVYDIQKYLTR